MQATRLGQAGVLFGLPFDFLNAKLRGRRGKLYAGARLRELARERTFTDLALRLYRREDIRTAVALERRLTAECVAELASVLLYVAEPHLTLFRALLDLFAVENIKVLLRLFGGREDPAQYLVEVPESLALPVEEMMESQDVGELLRKVPMPTVRACAQEALPLYRGTGRRAYLEMGLDKGYWVGVWQAFRQLPPFQARRCMAPVRMECDALRLTGTLRAAGTYGLPWDHWAAVVPPSNGRVSGETLRRVHEKPRVEFVRELLPWLEPLLARYGQTDQDLSVGALDEAMWREAVRLADRQYYADMTGPSVLVSYFYLKRDELRRMLELAQLVRYGRSEQEIAEQLGL